MRLPLARVAVCTVAIAGCASASAVNEQQRDPILVMVGSGTDLRYNKDVRVITNNIVGSSASAWLRLNAAYTKFGLQITERDSTNYAVAAQDNQFINRMSNKALSRVVDCGLTPLGSQRANSYRVWLTVASQLQSTVSGMTVRTTLVAKAQDPSSSTAPVQCGTTGALEHDIAQELGAQ